VLKFDGRGRRVLKQILASFIPAIVVGGSVGLSVWWMNARGDTLPGILLLPAWFSLLFWLMTLPAMLGSSIWGKVRRRPICGRMRMAGGFAWLFLVLWSARMEPIHQPVSGSGPHLSFHGVIDGSLVLLATGVLFWLLSRGRRRVWAALVFAASSSVGLELWALREAPARDRDEALEAIQKVVGGSTPVDLVSSEARKRVLVVALDGFDWQTVAPLLAQGKLPGIRRLLSTGAYYQMDNLHKELSPGIWTAVYTGQEEAGVETFTLWRFVGVRHDVSVLPHFRQHPVFLVNKFLSWTVWLGLWSQRPVTTKDWAAPPIWRIANYYGKRVGVIDPVPFMVVPELVQGFFAVGRGPRFDTYLPRPSGIALQTVLLPEGSPTGDRVRDAVEEERARLAAAVALFAGNPVDLGVYYTSFIDRALHLGWDAGFRGRWFTADVRSRAEEFLASERLLTPLYEQADATIVGLIAAFGPSLVVVVSDHGWEWNEFDHSLSPHGALIVAGHGSAGYGGTSSVLTIAPTILSALDLPADLTMASPVVGFEDGPTVQTHAGIQGNFLEATSDDPDRLRVLRSLGYLGR
jgi:hypothetical protein